MSRQKIKSVIEKRTAEIVLTFVLIGLIAATTQASEVSNILDAGSSSELVAEYRFDTGAGDTAFDTAGNNDGAIMGSTSWVDGVEGSALDFDDGQTSQYVDVPYETLDGLSDFTIAFWAYGGGSGEYVLSGANSNSDNHMLMHGPTASGWNFYVWRRGGGHGTHIYRNMVQDDSLIYSNPGDPINLDEGGLIIAQEQDSVGGNFQSGQAFSGKIDDFRIYDEALNDSELKSLMNQKASFRKSSTEESDSSKVLDMSFQHQNSTHVLDTSGQNNHGAPQNGASQEGAVNCKVGRCYSFDGSDDGVDTGTNTLYNEPQGAWMAWFKPDFISSNGFSHAGPNAIISATAGGCDDAYALMVGNSDQIGAHVDDGPSNNIISGGSVSTSEWNHATATYNSGIFQLYLNGKLVSNTSTEGNAIEDEACPEYIGNREDTTHYFNGELDQVKVFNRSLSQREIIKETEGLSSDGAVLDMKFESTGGDVVFDNSNYGNNGLLYPDESSGPERTGGIQGTALDFDGNDDHVRVADDQSFDVGTGDFSFSFWIYPRKKDSESGRVFNKRNSWKENEVSSYLTTSDSIAFRVLDSDNGNDDITISTPVELKKWQHITGLREDNNLKLYVDGELRGSKSGVGSITSSSPLYIGTRNNAQYWDGKIDNFQFRPYALSESEIKQSYNKDSSRIGLKSIDDLKTGLALSQSFDRIEACGRSDTISCPSGISGDVAVDESGEANHGELVNGPTKKSTKDCQVGGCLEFDGSDDYVNAGNSKTLQIKQNISVGAWVKTEAVSDIAMVVDDYRSSYSGGDHGYMLLLGSNGAAGFEGRDGSGYYHSSGKSSEIDDGEWHYLVGQREGSVWKIYVDGKLASKTDVGTTDSIDSNATDLTIGANQGGNKYEFKGKIDQVHVYNRAISKSEIWNLYTSGRDRSSAGEMAGPVGQWKFDSVEKSNAYDSAGNNVATINGANLTSGKKKTAMEFDGNDDYVDIPEVSPFDLQTLTVSAWVNFADNSNNFIFEKGDVNTQYSLFSHGDDIVFRTNPEDGSGYDTLEIQKDNYDDIGNNQWHHIVGTFDGTTKRLYVDSRERTSRVWKKTINTDSGSPSIGRFGGTSTGYYFTGKIDDVRIYPYALSQDQVKQVMNGGAVGSTTGNPSYPVPEDCQEIKDRHQSRISGIHRIDPDGKGSYAPFEVYCEMGENGGGWTRLNFLPDAHKGKKGAPFGDSDRGSGFGGDVNDGNLGLVNSKHDPDTSDGAFFQRSSNQRCTRWSAGNATRDTYQGITTGWDYYDAKGNPIHPAQLRALNETTADGTYYDGGVSVNDIDGPFPDGGDGDGGENSFSIPVDTSATHSPTGGGPIALWFSTTPDLDAGTTHVLGSDYDSREGTPSYEASWKPVNTIGIPMFFGGKVDNDANLYSHYSDSDTNDCETQAGSEFELENQYFYAR